MNRKKKLLFAIVAAAVLAVGGGVGFYAVKRVNAKIIPVIPMESLAQSYFYDESQEELSGEITTHVTQEVNLENDSVIDEVYVKTGDRVKAGDKLLSYDTTLTEMELNIEKLTKEKNEQDLKKAKDRLQELENGAELKDTDMENASFGDTDTGDDLGEDDVARSDMPGESKVMAVAAFRPIAAVKTQETEETAKETQTPEETETPEVTETPEETEAPEETETPEETQTPEETETPEPTETPQPQAEVYQVLDFDSVPYQGTGTAEDPYRFLCDAEEEYIIVKGSFLNKMAGYDEQGTEKIEEKAPFWYRIEFHEDNQIVNYSNPEASLIGYYVKKGGSEAVDAQEQKFFSVEKAMLPSDDTTVLTPTPTPTQEPDENWDDGDEDWYEEGEEGEIGFTREEAIKSKKQTIASLEIQIKTNALQISKLEKKIENQTVLATVDGQVTTVGDPVTGESDGDAFIVVDSDDGLYVKGAVSELLLDRLSVGQSLNVNSYETGLNFQAEIREISQFPADDASQYYSGMGNPNVSYYPFMAVVLGDEEPNNGESVGLWIDSEALAGDKLYVDAAFVRYEDGVYYVFKEEDGKLKKQIVTATKSFDGYTVTITSGLTMEDKIAFPYGKGVKEGAPVKEGTLDEVYGYY